MFSSLDFFGGDFLSTFSMLFFSLIYHNVLPNWHSLFSSSVKVNGSGHLQILSFFFFLNESNENITWDMSQKWKFKLLLPLGNWY